MVSSDHFYALFNYNDMQTELTLPKEGKVKITYINFKVNISMMMVFLKIMIIHLLE